MSLFKKIGNFVADTVKASVQPLVDSYDSVRGTDTDLGYKTKAGKKIGGVLEASADSIHGVLKGYADGMTLGFATKAANLVRKDENKEKAGQYHELTRKSDTGIGIVDKFYDKTKPIGAVAGGVLGAAALASGVGKAVGALKGGNKVTPSKGAMKYEGNLAGDLGGKVLTGADFLEDAGVNAVPSTNFPNPFATGVYQSVSSSLTKSGADFLKDTGVKTAVNQNSVVNPFTPKNNSSGDILDKINDIFGKGGSLVDKVGGFFGNNPTPTDNRKTAGAGDMNVGMLIVGVLILFVIGMFSNRRRVQSRY